MYFLILFLIGCIKTTESAVAIGLSSVHPSYPGSCIDDVTGNPHALGSSWPIPDTCGQQTCILRGDTLYISYESCGYSQAFPPCYTVQNMSLTYPACCPRVICEPVEKNEIDIDDYGHYEDPVQDGDHLYMMSSDDHHIVQYDSHVYDTMDLPAGANPEDYMVDWDTLFQTFDK